MAKLVSSRATCPRASCGCVIVSADNRLLTTGYNGSLPREPHCIDVGCELVGGHCTRAIHSELNAVTQAVKYGISLRGSRAYVYRRNAEDGSLGNGCCPNCLQILASAEVSLAGCWDE